MYQAKQKYVLGALTVYFSLFTQEVVYQQTAKLFLLSFEAVLKLKLLSHLISVAQLDQQKINKWRVAVCYAVKSWVCSFRQKIC